MAYKGIVKVYRTSTDVIDSPGGLKRGEVPQQSGLILDVTVTAKTEEGLVKKINAVLATMGEE